MDKFLEAISTKNTYTDNGALTNSTSLNKCLDFFSIAGNPVENIESFEAAYGEDPQLALRILFWSRDCRGGAGARKNFIAIMKKLQVERPEVFSKVFKFIPDFGYWKDIYNLKPTQEVVSFVAETLTNDIDHSLCAKYCPRKGEWFYHLRVHFKMSLAQFRHFIVKKTQVVETQICKKEWNEIEYSSVPSIANLRYKEIFMKYDNERYKDYIKSVLEGKNKINSSVLFPNQIFHKWCISLRKDYDTIKALWDNLPNYMEDCTERILPVCDVSGSMNGTPMEVSIALGCYISERNKGPFKDAFITFSEKPQINILTGDIISRFAQLSHADWGYNTNLQAVFDLILKRALENNLSNNDMPSKILIISDMQFDSALKNRERFGNPEITNYEAIKDAYALYGYKLPGIIFWNVRGDAGKVPVTMKDFNTGLVSGYSPSILTSILKGKVITPIEIMLNTVNSERYKNIKI